MIATLIRRSCISSLAAIALGALTGVAAAAELPGVSMRSADNGGRAVAVTLWYPAAAGGTATSVGASPVFEGVEGLENAPIADGRHHLILLSHGGLRSAPHHGDWLASALAAEGFATAVVRGPGLGPGDAAKATNEIAERPSDIGAVLDMFAADPEWAAHLDLDRVGAVGFFLGGTSVLMLAGVEIDPNLYAATCDDPEANAANIDCRWFQNGGVDLHQADTSAFATVRADPRVAAVVAVDPEFVGSFAVDSLPGIGAHVTIVNLGEGHSASDSAIPGANTVSIAGASHVSAFSACTPKGPAILSEEGEDATLCLEANGGSRAEIHGAISRAVVDALTAALVTP